LYGAETWTLRKVDQKYLERFEMWYWKRTDIFYSDRVRNEEVLHTVKGRNNLYTIKTRKTNWICHKLRRNCLLKHVTEGKLEGRMDMMERRRKRRKQLLDDLNEKTRYWKLKEEALDRTVWRIALEEAMDLSLATGECTNEVFVLSTRYSCQILMKLKFFQQILEKYSNIKFHENLTSVSRVVPCGETDGETRRR
jgi:hypothetical protein